MRVLVVTAVPAEADAVLAGLGRGPGSPAPVRELPLPGYLLRRHECPAPGDTEPATPGAFRAVDVLSAGVGPAAAAAGTAAALTAAALTGQPYGLVVSAGIGGGFPGTAPPGSVVVADAVVAADLGAQTPDGFLPVDRLGFGRSVHLPPMDTARRIAEALGGAGLDVALAPVLTVSTVTGGAARAAELAARHPGAGAEAMEGFGVAEAAAVHGLPVLEIRTVSNPVGPRDRTAWRIPEALAALTDAFGTLAGPTATAAFRALAGAGTGRLDGTGDGGGSGTGDGGGSGAGSGSTGGGSGDSTGSGGDSGGSSGTGCGGVPVTRTRQAREAREEHRTDHPQQQGRSSA